MYEKKKKKEKKKERKRKERERSYPGCLGVKLLIFRGEDDALLRDRFKMQSSFMREPIAFNNLDIQQSSREDTMPAGVLKNNLHQTLRSSADTFMRRYLRFPCLGRV